MSKIGNRLSGSTKQVYSNKSRLDVYSYTRSQSSIDREEMSKLVYGSLIKKRHKKILNSLSSQDHQDAQGTQASQESQASKLQPENGLEQSVDESLVNETRGGECASANDGQASGLSPVNTATVDPTDPDEIALQKIESAAEANDDVIDSKQVNWLNYARKFYPLTILPDQRNLLLPGSMPMPSGTNHMGSKKHKRRNTRHGR